MTIIGIHFNDVGPLAAHKTPVLVGNGFSTLANECLDFAKTKLAMNDRPSAHSQTTPSLSASFMCGCLWQIQFCAGLCSIRLTLPVPRSRRYGPRNQGRSASLTRVHTFVSDVCDYVTVEHPCTRVEAVYLNIDGLSRSDVLGIDSLSGMPMGCHQAAPL